jgi:hypothetical protein
LHSPRCGQMRQPLSKAWTSSRCAPAPLGVKSILNRAFFIMRPTPCLRHSLGPTNNGITSTNARLNAPAANGFMRASRRGNAALNRKATLARSPARHDDHVTAFNIQQGLSSAHTYRYSQRLDVLHLNNSALAFCPTISARPRLRAVAPGRISPPAHSLGSNSIHLPALFSGRGANAHRDGKSRGLQPQSLEYRHNLFAVDAV